MGLNDEIIDAVDWNTPTVAPTESIRSAIQKMATINTSAVGVMSEGEIVGVLTEMDLMISIDQGDDLDNTQVTRCMTACELLKDEKVKSPCAQLDASQTVENALGVMNRAGVHHLMVSDVVNNRVGVVSILGLLKLAIK
jgi:CBS domain-containing protein